jgi:septal ring factor EnvC (AmiA/AmiB activator)
VSEQRSILAIDLNRLEEECERNPKLAIEWGQELAKANANLADAEKKVKRIGAELTLAIRRDPESYMKGVKATDETVKAGVLSHPDYQAAEQEVIAAQYEVDMMKAMVYAIADRKTELENITQLHGQQYWSKPHTPTMESQKADRKASQAKAKVETKRK